MVENHDFDMVLLEIPLEELECKPTEPISRGKGNLLDVSTLDSLQKGDKVLALEVDAQPNVTDDLMVWELSRHKTCLSLKVIPLFC